MEDMDDIDIDRMMLVVIVFVMMRPVVLHRSKL